jgi:hypothetical protein
MHIAKGKPRRGALMIVVLVCLMVLVMLVGALLRRSMFERNQVRDEERRAQAEWLAESGVSLAAARLALDSSYRGETWDVAAQACGGHWPARVSIAVENVKDQPDRRSVKVRADYPVEQPLRARHSKQVVIYLGSRRSGEGS